MKRFKQDIISDVVRQYNPELWQKLYYQDYVSSKAAEREIKIIHYFINPNKIALDVGVHLGIYTRHLSKYAKAVIGFEANPDLAAFAKRSLSKIARIYWVALSSEQETAVLRVPVATGRRGEVALGTIAPSNDLGGRPYREIRVPASTLDSFDIPPVGFIKIDVEGHEEEVLEGGRQLILRDRPVCMIEIEERHNPGSLERLVRLFKQRAYDIAFYDGLSIRSIDEYSHLEHQKGGKAAYINNFPFFPPAFAQSRP